MRRKTLSSPTNNIEYWNIPLFRANYSRLISTSLASLHLAVSAPNVFDFECLNGKNISSIYSLQQTKIVDVVFDPSGKAGFLAQVIYVQTLNDLNNALQNEFLVKNQFPVRRDASILCGHLFLREPRRRR